MASASLAAGKEKQGLAAGYVQAAGAAACIAGPLIGTLLYTVSVEGPLVLAAGLLMLGSLGLLYRRDPRREQQEHSQAG